MSSYHQTMSSCFVHFKITTPSQYFSVRHNYTNMEFLPEDCIALVLSHLSPRDACRSTSVASMIKESAESDLLWDKFLPPDHQEIISKSVSPITYKSKKELFYKLSTPFLIDGGLKVINIKMFQLYCIFVEICYSVLSILFHIRLRFTRFIVIVE